MDYILQTNGLTKKYKNFQALNGLSMNVPKGSIYGFVGKNGAGKTTLIRLICGLQKPTSGDFTLYGIPSNSKDLIKSRRRMGAVVETPSIYMDMSAEDNLKQQYLVLGLPSYDDIPELLKLRLQHNCICSCICDCNLSVNIKFIRFFRQIVIHSTCR